MKHIAKRKAPIKLPKATKMPF